MKLLMVFLVNFRQIRRIIPISGASKRHQRMALEVLLQICSLWFFHRPLDNSFAFGHELLVDNGRDRYKYFVSSVQIYVSVGKTQFYSKENHDFQRKILISHRKTSFSEEIHDFTMENFIFRRKMWFSCCEFSTKFWYNFSNVKFLHVLDIHGTNKHHSDILAR